MKIIQFIHDGPQFPLSRNNYGHERITISYGIRYWNQERNHKRKFIFQNGFYLENIESQVKTGLLNFWGEWEAQSFYKINSNRHPSPNSIHKPIFIQNEIPPRTGICHSTDPYVFNINHLFTHCKQEYFSGIRDLDAGSIILFGSKIDNQFVLDEVFVVGGILELQVSYADFITENTDILKFKNPNIFFHVNYDYINHFNSIYYGKSYLENNSFFSYFPCKVNNRRYDFFDRPIIPDNIFDTEGTKMQGLKYIEENSSLEYNKKYWKKLTEHLIKEGYYLGLYADEPDYYTTLANSRNGFKPF